MEHRILIRNSKKVNLHVKSIIKSGRSGNSRNFFWREILEQTLDPGLTKVNNFWTYTGISRKFLRDVHKNVINSGLSAGISRKFLREDTARKCIYPTTGQTRVPSRLANHVFKSRSVTVVPAQLTSGMTSGLTAGVTPPWPSRGQPRRAQERLRSD